MKNNPRPTTAHKQIELPEGLTLEQSIELIYDHQKNCEKKGNYVQAELAKRKVQQLRNEFDRLAKQQLHVRQRQQKAQIQKLHLEELSTFNTEWDSIQQQFQMDIDKAESQMLARHNQQLLKYQSELQESLPAKPKQSPELMNLRKIQENLAKHQNYVQAHKVQQRANQLQRAQMQRYQVQRSQKLKNLILQLKNRQDAEISALRQKIILGVQQKKRQRTLQLQKILQKYSIHRKQIDCVHNQEVSRIQKGGKQTGGSYSKYSSKASVLSKR